MARLNAASARAACSHAPALRPSGHAPLDVAHRGSALTARRRAPKKRPGREAPANQRIRIKSELGSDTGVEPATNAVEDRRAATRSSRTERRETIGDIVDPEIE